MAATRDGEMWRCQFYYKDMEYRLRENTMRTKKFIIDLKIIPYFKKKCMNEIKASDIRAWQNTLIKRDIQKRI